MRLWYNQVHDSRRSVLETEQDVVTIGRDRVNTLALHSPLVSKRQGDRSIFEPLHSKVGRFAGLWARDDAPNGVPANQPVVEQKAEPAGREARLVADLAD